MRFKRSCSLGVAAAIGMSVLAGAAAAAAGGNGDRAGKRDGPGAGFHGAGCPEGR